MYTKIYYDGELKGEIMHGSITRTQMIELGCGIDLKTDIDPNTGELYDEFLFTFETEGND